MRTPSPLFAAPFVVMLAVAGCGGGDGGSGSGGIGATPTPTPTASPSPSPTTTQAPTTVVTAQTIATFDNPWAMVFLPDLRMLVTEKAGQLRIVTGAGVVGTPISGVPAVVSTGQGGLLDVALDPAFSTNRRIYLSYSEAGSGGAGLAVMRATLTLDGSNSGALSDTSVIWRQTPKLSDTRHYGGRMAFGSDGRLFITAGERHQGAPAQDLTVTLGKIVRINTDGTIPVDNPFVATAGARPEIWSLGHRNPYGLVLGSDGRLVSSEMGPDAGDELNIITRGANYGWRLVSEGSDGGEALPRHSTRPDLAAPAFFWSTNIAPSGMIQYTGTAFVDWQGDYVLAGLVSNGLVQMRFSGNTASEVRRIALGARIREVEQGPDGNLYILEDGTGGRLRRLTPAL